ncbi:MAG: sugar ABC transporter permease [Anaerolineaceae bacterium]|nr:sugar ABC transporter permease [Anaerolineaceae bacterium]
MRNTTRQAIWGYIFILPAMIFFLIWVVLPLVTAVGMSFTDYNAATAHFIGLENYLDIFHRPETFIALWNTIQFGLELIPLNIVISLFLAILVDQKLRGITFFRTAYYLPVLTSLVVAGIVWSALYDYRAGPINAILGWFGLPAQQWLTDATTALSSVVMVRVWKGVGFNMMVFLAGLQGIPTELYEAAMMDGAKAWNRLRYITLPMLMPTTFYVFVMACISSFQVFGEIYVMTKGGPAGATKTLIYLIWEQAFEYSNLGYASALAVVLLLLVGAIAFFNLYYVNRYVTYDQ